MNGIHDLGGMHGFGPVQPEIDEPVFHAPWEGRVLALMRAVLYTRAWNLDRFRDAQERVPAATYLAVSYYHRWLLALRAGVVATGLVQPDELEAGHALHPARAVERTLGPANVEAAFRRPPFARPAPAPARFAPGERVRTRNLNPAGHTRLPRYARDRVGVVEAVRGCHVYPDAVVSGQGQAAQWLYTVLFDGRTLWGEGADPTLQVSVEAFEPYLEEA